VLPFSTSGNLAPAPRQFSDFSEVASGDLWFWDDGGYDEGTTRVRRGLVSVPHPRHNRPVVEASMTIQYSDGRTTEAIILNGDLNTIRVAVRGSNDALTLLRTGNSWTVDGAEPVEISFAWQQPSASNHVTEEDCICSKQLAAALIRHLLSEDESEVVAEEWPVWNTSQQAFAMAASAASIN